MATSWAEDKGLCLQSVHHGVPCWVPRRGWGQHWHLHFPPLQPAVPAQPAPGPLPCPSTTRAHVLGAWALYLRVSRSGVWRSGFMLLLGRVLSGELGEGLGSIG